jgi:hypothetical protein
MKIGVRFNCQGEGLATCLRALLPDAEVVLFPAQAELPVAEQAARASVLAGCDHVITAQFGGRHGKLSTAALKRTVKALHVLPVFSFAGFHPDMTYVPVDGRALPGPTGVYHARIAIMGYLAGLSAQETEGLYNRLAFSRLGYLDAYALQSQLLVERWAKDDVAAENLLVRWRETGCFAHSVNHPKMVVLLDLARIACARMGLVPRAADIDPAGLPDVLARDRLHPVFPDIAASIGVAPEGCFSAGLDPQGNRVAISMLDFLLASFASFATAPEQSLRAVPGVQEGMAALGLGRINRPAGRRPKSAAMALLTYHGSLVRTGAVPGQLLHRAITASGQDAPTVVADCSAPAVMQETGGLAGAVIRETGPALVTVTRDFRYFCAERDNEVASFSRHSAGNWEAFLPLAPKDLAVLQYIVATDWFLGATGERIPRTLIRLADGYTLQFGRWRIDLIRDFPLLTRGADEPDAILTLKLDGEMCSLVPAVAAQEAAPAPAELLSPGRQLVLAGADAWLPPPVTAGDADRAWLYGAARDKTALDGRAKPTAAALRRAADEMLGEGAPQGRIPGVSVRFIEAWDGPDGFAQAALRLHVLSAVAPAEAAYLLPAETPEAFVQGLAALGFGGLKFVRLPTAPVMAADLIWLDEPDLTALPAEALAGPRVRTGVRAAGTRRLFWPEDVTPATAAALAQEGFEAVQTGLAPLLLTGLLAQAGWVAGVSGRLKLLFCPAGTRVVEFCNAAVFGGEAWLMAAKLGMMHGVLPCTARNGVLSADAEKLSALLQVMMLRS